MPSRARQDLAPGRNARCGAWQGDVALAAVDEHGFVLDILLQDRRDTDAAKRFFEQLLEDYAFAPEKIVTDQLGSYEAALKEIPALESVKHVFVKSEARLNNRIERDHEFVRERQRSSRGWRSPTDKLEV
jgi:putative transposase